MFFHTNPLIKTQKNIKISYIHFNLFQVLAKVVRTGFYTAKGELIKSILFPKQLGFQFYNDAVKFVLFMFCIAGIGMAYSIWLYVLRGVSAYTFIIYKYL